MFQQTAKATLNGDSYRALPLLWTKCGDFWLPSSFLIAFVGRSAGRVHDLDWSTTSSLFDHGFHTATVFARLNDLLRFRCSSTRINFEIHLVTNPMDALTCAIHGTSTPIGFCGPKTSDPRLALRSISLVPNQPTFLANRTYFFLGEPAFRLPNRTAIPVGSCALLPPFGRNAQNEPTHELCERYGMRMKMVVVERDSTQDMNRVFESTQTDNQSIRGKHALRQTNHQHPSHSPARPTARIPWTNPTYFIAPPAGESERSGPGRVYTVDGKEAEEKQPVVMPYDPNARPGDFGLDFEIGYEDQTSGSERQGNVPSCPSFAHSFLLPRFIDAVRR
ncbi:hypothetical protein M3Y99_01362600 [Aphelenchoides fujianensis]|nr:hypothetical protein M3Y99_01362600 [Aphelenchoides fujianensis]